MSLRAKKILCYTLASFYGLGLIAWPFMSGMIAFIFDDGTSPLKYYIAISTWLYPAYWGLGLYLGLRAIKQNKSAILIALLTSAPLLSAMMYAAVPTAGMLAWEMVMVEQFNSVFSQAPEIYQLDEQRIAVQNYQGRFTDFKGYNFNNLEPHSAWIVDFSKDVPDKKGRIYLTKNNLERYYFRDNSKKILKLIPEWSANNAAGDGTYYKFKFGDPNFTLITKNGEYNIYIQQK